MFVRQISSLLLGLTALCAASVNHAAESTSIPQNISPERLQLDKKKWGAAKDVASVAPRAVLDLKQTAPSAQLSGAPVVVEIQGDTIGWGTYLTMRQESTLYIRVEPNTRPGTLQNGTYRVRVNMSNVGFPTTVNMEGGGQRSSCPLQIRPGYRNLQPCDLVATATNAPEVYVSVKVGVRQEVTVDSVEVFKER